MNQSTQSNKAANTVSEVKHGSCRSLSIQIAKISGGQMTAGDVGAWKAPVEQRATAKGMHS